MRPIKTALKNACLAALFPALLAGCTMAPKYERPSPPLPSDWTTGGAAQSQPGAAAQDWRAVITDAPTRHLVELALNNNRDLRVALLNVEKSQAMHGITRANLFPHIDATAAGNMNRTPATLSGTGKPITTRAYSVGLGFSSFELDLFGRLRSLNDQAFEQFLSSEANAKGVELTLIAQTASGYMTLAADREHLATAKEILQTEQSSYDLVKQRFENGIANELDLSQAQTTVDTARISVATYTSQVTQDENALAVLIGMPVTSDLTPAQKLADIAPLADVPAGLPSTVLFRRPDVIGAEHDLKAANAYVGAARASFFPTISLTGSYGTASNAINGLFKNGSQQWSFVPSLDLPIFRAGSIIAALRYSKADREAMIATYEKTVQTAFREVSDTLTQATSLRDQVEAETSLAKATGKSYELSTMRYENGVDSYLTKLDSQRADASARQNLITARLSQATNRLTLFKALGGGWNGQDEPESAALLRKARAAK